MAAQAVDPKTKLESALQAERVEIRGPVSETHAEILTVEALRFLA